MPIAASTAAIIAAAIAATGTAGSAGISNIKGRKRSQEAWVRGLYTADQENKRNDEVWERNSQFAIDMWNRQNQYNSPAQQMARYRDAGLSPHLMYQQGSTGNAQSPPDATLANAADIPPFKPAEHKSILQGHKAFDNFNAFRTSTAQIDNTKAGTDLTKQQQINMATANLIQLKDVNLRDSLDPKTIESAEYNLQIQMEQLKQQEAKTELDLGTLKNKLREQAENTKSAINRTKGMSLDNKIKEQQLIFEKFKAVLAKNKQNINDPAWQRMLIQWGFMKSVLNPTRQHYKGKLNY